MPRRFTDASELLGDLLDRYEDGSPRPIAHPHYEDFADVSELDRFVKLLAEAEVAGAVRIAMRRRRTADCFTGSICRASSTRVLPTFARHGIEAEPGKASPRRTPIGFGLRWFSPRPFWTTSTVASTTERFPASSPATAKPSTRSREQWSDC